MKHFLSLLSLVLLGMLAGGCGTPPQANRLDLATESNADIFIANPDLQEDL